MTKEKIEQLKEYKKILYNVDMVNGFVRMGALHDPNIATKIPEQIKIIEYFNKSNQAISFIKDNHTPECEEFKKFPPHCIIGTEEAELVDELKCYEKSALVYPKNSTSAFVAPGLLDDLNNMTNLEEIVGVGCCTDICIPNFFIPLKNYFNQINKSIDIILVKKAIDTYHIEQIHDRNYFSKIAYELMSQAGIIIVNDYEKLKEKEKQLEKKRGK